MQPRPGPATARPALTHPLGLALRLQRGVLIGWSAAMFFSGLSIGLTGRDAKSLVGGNSDQLTQILGSSAGDVVDQYFAVSMLTMALIGAGFGIQVALRMRAEETSGRLEPLLATALSRWAWSGAYVTVAMAGSVVVLAANGRRRRRGRGDQRPRRSPSCGSCSRPASCPRPRCGSSSARRSRCSASFRAPRSAGWGVLGACGLLTVLGSLLGLPAWVLDLSPFQHVPQLPAADFAAGPLLALCAVAAALTAVGMAAFRRRDLAP